MAKEETKQPAVAKAMAGKAEQQADDSVAEQPQSYLDMQKAKIQNDIKAGVAKPSGADAPTQPEQQDDEPSSETDTEAQGKESSASTDADQGEESGEFTPSETQVQLAKQAGYTDDEITKMSDVEMQAAERAARKMSGAFGKQGRRMKELTDTIGKLTERLESLESGRSPEKDESTGEPKEKSPLDVELSAEEYGEELASNWKAMQAELKRVREELDGVRGASEQQQQSELEAQTETFFSDLEQDVFNRFDDQEEREDLVDLAVDIQDTRKARTGDELPWNQALNIALNTLCPDEIKQAAEREVQQSSSKPNRTRTARPTHRPRQSSTAPKTTSEKNQEIKSELARRGNRALTR